MKTFFSKIIFSLGLILCLGLVGCGKAPEVPPNNGDEIVEPSQPEKPTDPENPVKPPIEEEKPSYDLTEKFKTLADEVLGVLDMNIDMGLDFEQLLDKIVTKDKIELLINLSEDEIDDEYLQEEIKLVIEDSGIENLKLTYIHENGTLQILITIA